jgi:cystathionine beta-lyase
MYDFDKLTDRSGTLSYKWDVEPGELPMWVADMDLEAPPAVVDAVKARAAHGIYGYSTTPKELFSAVSDYWCRRHGFRFSTEWMVYSNGVVAALSSMVRRLTCPGENVLIQAPV